MHLKKYKNMIIAFTVILALCAAGAMALASDAPPSARLIAAGSLIARSHHGSLQRPSHLGLNRRGSRRGLRYGGSRHGLRGGYYDGPRFGPYDGPPLARHYKYQPLAPHYNPYQRIAPHYGPYPRIAPHYRPYPRIAPHYRPYPRIAPHYRPYPRLAPHYRPYRYEGRRSGYQISPRPGSYYRLGPDQRGYYFYYFSLPYRRFTYNYWPYYRGRIYPQHPRDYPYYHLPSSYDHKPTLPQQAESELEDSRIAEQLGKVAHAFVQADYDQAVRRACNATEAVPESTVLPFVYSQSLFAASRYQEAADVLRNAVLEVDLETQGVFFSPGFYADINTLKEQITELTKTADANPQSPGLQLLLGYQLLAVANYDQAAEALDLAERDPTNKQAAARLKYILEQTKKIEPEPNPPKNQK